MSETSFPERLADVERKLHTVEFRLEQFDAQRLPDRMTGVEATMQNMQRELSNINETAHYTNELIGDMRQEINADLNSAEESFAARSELVEKAVHNLDIRVTSMTNRVVGAVAASTVFVGAIVWIIEKSNVLGLILKSAMGG